MIFFLAKFFKNEEHAEQFMRGKLYANRLVHFRELEGDANRGDVYEGVALLQGELKLALSTDGSPRQEITITERDLEGPMEVRMNWTNHVNLFCMYAAHSGDYENILPDRVDQFKKEQIEIPNDCMAFGEHSVVITNAPQFVERVKGAVRKIKNYKLRGRGRLIRYGGAQPLAITSVNTIFHKRDEYKHQREFRFAFFTGKDICDPLILEIGDISDIAVRCNSAEINRGIQMSFRT